MNNSNEPDWDVLLDEKRERDAESRRMSHPCSNCGADMEKIQASQKDGTDIEWYECPECGESEDA